MGFFRNRMWLILSSAVVGVIVIATVALLSLHSSPKPLTTHSSTIAITQNTPTVTPDTSLLTATTMPATTVTALPATGTVSPTLVPISPTHGTKPPTPKPASPTYTPMPPAATATVTPTSTFPQLSVTTPDGDSATCGTATQTGKFPRVVITNIGGGTLNWIFSFPSEPSTLDFTYKLSATVNGQSAQSAVDHYYLTTGQSATFQLYQDTLWSTAAANLKPLAAALPPNDMVIDFWNADNIYAGIQEMYPCINYPPIG